MKKLLFIMLVLMTQAITIQEACAQFTHQVLLSYDANGNRTTRNVVLIRVDEETFANDSIGNSSNDEHYTDNGLDTINDISISIYPNPTYGLLMVSANLDDNSAPINMSLLSFGGKLIDEKTMTSRTTEFDLTSLPSGVYFLILNGKEERHVWKIIKNN